MTALTIARMTVRVIARDRSALFWMLLMPLLFTFFFNLMMGGDGEPRPTGISVVDEDRGFFSQELLGQIDSEDVETLPLDGRAEAESLLAAGEITRFFFIPPGLSDSITDRSPTELEYVVRGRETSLRANLAEVRIYQAVIALLANLIVAETIVADEEAGEAAPSDLEARYERAKAMPDRVTLTSEAAGRRRVIPSGIEHILSGMVVMFILLTMLTGGAATLVSEREGGVLARIFRCPVRRSDIILGKTLGHLIVGVLQTLVLVLAGAVLFRFPLFRQSLAGMALLLGSYLVAGAALGVAFGAYFRQPDRAAWAGVITTLGMAALGGCWWPLEVVPRYMQYVARLLPTGWATDGLHLIFFFGRGVTSVIPHALVLLCFAALFLIAATRRLRVT